MFFFPHLFLTLLIIIFAEEKTTVECSFITEFEDHIFVTVDAEAFFFLHDLISSYLREKERTVILLNAFLAHSILSAVHY